MNWSIRAFVFLCHEQVIWYEMGFFFEKIWQISSGKSTKTLENGGQSEWPISSMAWRYINTLAVSYKRINQIKINKSLYNLNYELKLVYTFNTGRASGVSINLGLHLANKIEGLNLTPLIKIRLIYLSNIGFALCSPSSAASKK